MDKQRKKQFLDAIDIVCCECIYGSDKNCDNCPVYQTYKNLGGIQRLRSEYIKGHTRALLDVRNYIENHEMVIKHFRLTQYKNMLKLINALIAGREELRETGDVKLIMTKDGHIKQEEEVKKHTKQFGDEHDMEVVTHLKVNEMNKDDIA
jgi:hypothetical protein